MQCVKCGGEVWDNRAKKASGEFKANGPDFSCKNKDGCGWVQWPPKTKASPVATQAPIAPPAGSQAPQHANGRDAALVALYWQCFDEIMEGVARRKLTDMFRPEHLCAAISTLYIQRAKG